MSFRVSGAWDDTLENLQAQSPNKVRRAWTRLRRAARTGERANPYAARREIWYW